MNKRIKHYFLFLLCAITFFSGCALIPKVPGGEPFGEETYSKEEGEAALDDFRFWMSEKDLSDGSYYVGFSENSGHELEVEYWHSEKYTAASATVSPYKEYLWYQGTLFLGEQEQLTARPISWEKLEGGALSEQAEEYLRLLLPLAPEEITYQYIPMAGSEPYMLKMEYPHAKWELFGRETPATVVVYFDEAGNPGSVSLSCNTPAVLKDGLFVRGEDSFFASWAVGKKEGVYYQAERKVWSFGYNHGLTKEENVVPALFYQKENRKACQKIIESMDFEALSKEAAQDDELALPFFQEFCARVKER